jgi:hypothetical protein
MSTGTEIVIHHEHMGEMTAGELLGLHRALAKVADDLQDRFPGAARFSLECAIGVQSEMQRRGMIGPQVKAILN